MSQYLVRIPFSSYTRGTVLEESIEQAARFRMLIDGEFLEKIEAGTVHGVFICCQKFRGDGTDWLPGQLIDLRNRQWRNETALLNVGMIRRATRSDLDAGDDNPSPVHSYEGNAALTLTPEVTVIPQTQVPEEAYKNENWLKTEYTTKHRTMTDIGNEFGISPQNVGYWLKKFEIKSRPRGTPKP